MHEDVKAWVETVNIPTYGIGKPEKNPIFLQKRVYQGSSGAVYPHPVVEKILDEKKDKAYTAVFIENEYLRIMILPALGGRVQRAYDKIRKRDFIYYNQVIKPALVGLTGPWISGGIEFNWPQHHRPSTFEPVDFCIEENEDGSKTVWVNEMELMTRTKGMAGFTLYPGKAYLQVKVKLHNRTFFPQTFLWWANPAVKVNDHYQSVFPPDVHAVFDHGKRDVSDFPIATGTYYKVNYGPGTDISRYKNIPVPTSFMAASSKYDFIGCYEHDTQAGMLHVADHHVVPGKKQWTWGNGDFGKAWDRNLTDEDGPYIELMCGAFTDNQPDFSWLQPNEEKSFEQYFMPYARIGAVKNASRDAAVNLEFNEKTVSVKVYATAVFPNAKVALLHEGKELLAKNSTLSPADILEFSTTVKEYSSQSSFTVTVSDENGKLLVSYTPESEMSPMPPPATAALQPGDISTNELLYLNGLHLEQYRHATFRPTDYYEEALRRDPDDIRVNNAMGIWLLRRAQFAKAQPYFRRAIASLVQRNPNPSEGEAYYNLGVCLKLSGQLNEAYAMFYKSVWNDAMQHSAYLQLARIEVIEGHYEKALDFIEKSLAKNSRSHTALHLKSVILRKLGREQDARNCSEAAINIDKFNYGCRYETLLLSTDQEKSKLQRELLRLTRGWFNNFVELAIDYMHAGCYEEAAGLMEIYLTSPNNEAINPLAYYYLSYFQLRSELFTESYSMLQRAAEVEPDYCFPSRIEDVLVLTEAVNRNERDHRALYYLGNYWYANEQWQDAISCWERSAALNSNFPTVQRNLALAYHNRLKEVDRSLACMEHAFQLDPSDARILMELDQLYKLVNRSPKSRLQLLENHLPLVEQRDDLYLERVTIYNQLGQHATAKELLASWKFHPWEGGEGKTVAQHYWCHVELAKKAMEEANCGQALKLLDEAAEFPLNLAEGKLPGAQENDLYFLRGICYERLGSASEARQCFEEATKGISEPVQAIFYNDPQPDKIIYQGLAWIRLGKKAMAEQIFKNLIAFGDQHINDDIRIDYFAVSLPDLLVFDQDLNRKNRIHCIYLKALGNLGLGNTGEASALFKEVLSMNINHQGALVHQQMINFLKQELQTA